MNWIVWNRHELFVIELIIYIKMDLALNNLQRWICYKTQPTNQHTHALTHIIYIYIYIYVCVCVCVCVALNEEILLYKVIINNTLVMSVVFSKLVQYKGKVIYFDMK